ncbi:MAG: DUF4177 domain-containing protein [Myxococcota bacterium]
MDRWEYRVLQVRSDEEAVERFPRLQETLQQIEARLNAFGQEGWEVVSAGPFEGIRVEGIVAVLKRRIST